jgi:nucleotide-binding universal stress UspA family protein
VRDDGTDSCSFGGFGNGGESVETIIEHGPPGEKILDVSEEIGCNLIVIGSRGETGARRWRFGSVAFKVVKSQTAMPVLVVST